MSCVRQRWGGSKATGAVNAAAGRRECGANGAGLAGVDMENHLNQTSQKERSGQHAVVKPELFFVGGACINLDLDLV